MTGAELTAAASDFSVVSLVFLVMMGGCVFGMAIGYPWHWIAVATVLFLFAIGYVGCGMLVAAFAVTLRRFAPNVLSWLESLNINRDDRAHHDAFSRYRSGDRYRDRAHGRTGAKANSDARYNYDDLFGEGARQKRPEAPSERKGPSPESILGLSSGFSVKDLDDARRRLAKKFHPDLHRRASVKKQEYMAEKMRAVNSAYEALKTQMA